MDNSTKGYEEGKAKTRKKLMEKYSAIVEERALLVADIEDLKNETAPNGEGLFSMIGSLFGSKPKKPEKTERELGYEKGELEEKTRFMKLFMDWFEHFKTLDKHTFDTKFASAVENDAETLDWQFVMPNTKDPPHERLMSGRYHEY